MSVVAAHEALRDVLSLSVVTKEGVDGVKSQSRLPKELLQTCIRPVLLNLRDYTRLSIPLLRGLARLLSLLSSWFNKTLGEKLLEHLQKWIEPERIIARKIWKEGDEPIVASYILDLFSLLPHASQFVEPLVKSAIKLDAALPRFKTHLVHSPYRRPLAKYLSKHSQYSVGFFFQRLQNPMYTDLFQEIIRLPDSEPLRHYLSGRQSSVMLLNVCFERPLAIIRSQKTASSASKSSRISHPSPDNPNEILALHGILIDPATTSKQKELRLRQDIDVKQKKLHLLQQEAVRAKEAFQARAGAGVPSQADLQRSYEDAKRRNRVAQVALEKGQKELSESKQRYATEIAHPKSAATSDPTASSSRRTMSMESLELQHQGFKLVESLVVHNEAYLKQHNDVVRAFRWLWRSKGRHLRLQHEQRMPPRFHQESELLASLLVNYARAFPSDVDVLFELLRIFLQPTTTDYSFVKEFLKDTVSHVLTFEKKRHVVQRFFTLLAGEGPEETKVLSIQLIVFPMLSSTFSLSAKAFGERRDAGDTPMPDRDKIANVDGEKKHTEVFDAESIQRFVKSILLREDGHPAVYGDRLRVELLRLSTLLLEFASASLDEHRKELIKFSWGLLKNEDTVCKNWAYLNVCRFIAAFDTPPKIILQVYVALIKSYQHEARGLVRSATAVLVPAMLKRLPAEDLDKVTECTSRILNEEANNAPQMAHVLHIVVSHPDLFRKCRENLAKHMINSIGRIGLPPNCPLHNRSLTLDAIKLILKWETDSTGDSGSQQVQSMAPPTKKSRGLDGAALPVESTDIVDSDSFSLTQEMVSDNCSE